MKGLKKIVLSKIEKNGDILLFCEDLYELLAVSGGFIDE